MGEPPTGGFLFDILHRMRDFINRLTNGDYDASLENGLQILVGFVLVVVLLGVWIWAEGGVVQFLDSVH